MTKNHCINLINNAIENAIKNGFIVAVASDEEGNNFNELNPVKYPMFYNANEVNDKAIVLGVYRPLDEDTLFYFHN